MPGSYSTPDCPEPVPVGFRCLACARDLAARRHELAEVTPPAAQRRRGRPRRSPGAAA